MKNYTYFSLVDKRLASYHQSLLARGPRVRINLENIFNKLCSVFGPMEMTVGDANKFLGINIKTNRKNKNIEVSMIKQLQDIIKLYKNKYKSEVIPLTTKINSNKMSKRYVLKNILVVEALRTSVIFFTEKPYLFFPMSLHNSQRNLQRSHARGENCY